MYTQCPDCQTAFRVAARELQKAAGWVRCGHCSNAFMALERLSADPPGPATFDDGGSASAGRETPATELDDPSGPSDVQLEDTGIEWRVLDEHERGERGLRQSGALRWRFGVPPAAWPHSASAAVIPELQDVIASRPEPGSEGIEVEESGAWEFDAERSEVVPGEERDWTDLLRELAPAGPTSDSTGRAALPPDLETQFRRQAAAMGIGGATPAPDAPPGAGDSEEGAPGPRGEEGAPPPESQPTPAGAEETRGPEARTAAAEHATGTDSSMTTQASSEASRDTDTNEELLYAPRHVSVEQALRDEAQPIGEEATGSEAEDAEVRHDWDVTTDVALDEGEPAATHARTVDDAVTLDAALENTGTPESPVTVEDEEITLEAALDDTDERPAINRGAGADDPAAPAAEEKAAIVTDEEITLEAALDDTDERPAVQPAGADDPAAAAAAEQAAIVPDEEITLEAALDETDERPAVQPAGADDTAAAAAAEQAAIVTDEEITLEAALDDTDERPAVQPAGADDPAAAAAAEQAAIVADEKVTLEAALDDTDEQPGVQQERGIDDGAATSAAAEVAADVAEPGAAAPAAKSALAGASACIDDASAPSPDGGNTGDSLLVESIILEGEDVESAWDTSDIADPRGLVDTYNREQALADEAVRRTGRWRRYASVAGTALLALVLLGQVMHAFRQTLATEPLFRHTIGLAYAMAGCPVTPKWNVHGWELADTHGGVETMDGDVLTVKSRVRNVSGGTLPLPHLYFSVTDRWDAVIGSRVLAPVDYARAANRARRPGESVAATFSIEALPREATGFKLSACYPGPDERLRCAAGDFRD